MRRVPLKALLPLLLLVLALGLAACGDDDDGGGGGGTSAGDFAPPTSAPDDAKKGGTLTVISAADPDYIDPGAAYYQYSYMFDNAIFRTLLAWPPDEETEPQPDLADGPAEVSEDGKTITFKLKSGIRYQPPVNREIRAEDFKYAIERGLLPGVSNPYINSYLGNLEGFAAAQKAVEQNSKVAPEISGITTPDDSTLVLKLTKPTNSVALQSLSLPLGSPVPEEYAKEFDADSPSTYGEHVVGTGPYMIENDESGTVTGFQPGKSLTLVRNPNWDESTDFRPAYVDRIEVKTGFTDVNSAIRKILTGNGQIQGDIIPEPEGLKLAATEYPDQLSLNPSGGNRYPALNTQIPPFNDVNVRKATLAGVDREALRLARGGELVGPIATHFIPPGIPGFEEAGGEAGPGFELMSNPKGDQAVAAKYFRKAGFESGKYEGPPILMIGENAGVDKRVSEVLRDELTKLGFNVDARLVSGDTAYTKFCQVPGSKYNVCATTGWLKDFIDPFTILDPTFNGKNILPSNNVNYPVFDDPAVNKAMDKAALIFDPGERAKAWGEIDKMITAQAPALVYLWDDQPNTRSSDVNGVLNLFNSQWDLSFTSLKNP